jgi:hypothetical protein
MPGRLNQGLYKLGWFLFVFQIECVRSKINPFVAAAVANISCTSWRTLEPDLTGCLDQSPKQV